MIDARMTFISYTYQAIYIYTDYNITILFFLSKKVTRSSCCLSSWTRSKNNDDEKPCCCGCKVHRWKVTLVLLLCWFKGQKKDNENNFKMTDNPYKKHSNFRQLCDFLTANCDFGGYPITPYLVWLTLLRRKFEFLAMRCLIFDFNQLSDQVAPLSHKL